MKVLILVIYSESLLYNKMLDLQRTYIHSNPLFQVYFVKFNQHQNEQIKILDDIINVKGIENRMNITEKTIKSLEFLIKTLGLTYDFIIRSNISTIINLNLLLEYLNNIPKTNIYTSGNLLNLEWIDNASGIKNKNLFGTIYASGTNIIFSFDVVLNMIENQTKIRHDIIDDVSFGVYINNYLPELIKKSFDHQPSFLIYTEYTNLSEVENKIFIRNKINNNNIKRNIDLDNMDKIIKYFQFNLNNNITDNNFTINNELIENKLSQTDNELDNIINNFLILTKDTNFSKVEIFKNIHQKNINHLKKDLINYIKFLHIQLINLYKFNTNMKKNNVLFKNKFKNLTNRIKINEFKITKDLEKQHVEILKKDIIISCIKLYTEFKEIQNFYE